MIRLYLFAEGSSEQRYAQLELGPHLLNFGVELRTVKICASKSKGRIFRGGGQSYEPMRRDLLNHLRTHRHNRDVRVTTMIDLYSIHRGFPRFDEADPLRHLPHERVRFLESAFADDIRDHRFIPHLQLHEFEAMLFCDPRVFCNLDDRAYTKAAEAMEAIRQEFASPELIDDGPKTAPSKRIIELIPDYADMKSEDGPDLACIIGLPALRGQMPHFDAWLASLEALGGVAA